MASPNQVDDSEIQSFGIATSTSGVKRKRTSGDEHPCKRMFSDPKSKTFCDCSTDNPLTVYCRRKPLIQRIFIKFFQQEFQWLKDKQLIRQDKLEFFSRTLEQKNCLTYEIILETEKMLKNAKWFEEQIQDKMLSSEESKLKEDEETITLDGNMPSSRSQSGDAKCLQCACVQIIANRLRLRNKIMNYLQSHSSHLAKSFASLKDVIKIHQLYMTFIVLDIDKKLAAFRQQKVQKLKEDEGVLNALLTFVLNMDNH